MVYILLSILLATSLYVNFNLFRKIEQLETANEEYSIWVEDFEIRIKQILNTIKSLDSKEMFESDDEVGAVYKQISDTVKELEDVLNEA